MPLENGIQVSFSDGMYTSGGYWLIPARTAVGKQASFTFYVNGQVVSEQTLTEFSSGTSGVYFEAVSPDPISFDLDNLLLRAP